MSRAWAVQSGEEEAEGESSALLTASSGGAAPVLSAAYSAAYSREEAPVSWLS